MAVHIIRFLDLYKCYNISDVGNSSICRACLSSLKTFEIGDGTILSLTKFCGNLETLLIGDCWLLLVELAAALKC